MEKFLLSGLAGLLLILAGCQSPGAAGGSNEPATPTAADQGLDSWIEEQTYGQARVSPPQTLVNGAAFQETAPQRPAPMPPPQPRDRPSYPVEKFAPTSPDFFPSGNRPAAQAQDFQMAQAQPMRPQRQVISEAEARAMFFGASTPGPAGQLGGNAAPANTQPPPQSPPQPNVSLFPEDVEEPSPPTEVATTDELEAWLRQEAGSVALETGEAAASAPVKPVKPVAAAEVGGTAPLISANGTGRTSSRPFRSGEAPGAADFPGFGTGASGGAETGAAATPASSSDLDSWLETEAAAMADAGVPDLPANTAAEPGINLPPDIETWLAESVPTVNAVRNAKMSEVEDGGSSVEGINEVPRFGVSQNVVVGKLTWIDPEGKKAVLYLDNMFLKHDDYMLTRNDALETTSILRFSGIARGRSIGVEIIGGETLVGEQVVVPGPQLRSIMMDFLAQSNSEGAE